MFNKNMELTDDALESVSGGIGELSGERPVPPPSPTGEAEEICPVCGARLQIATRDSSVTCSRCKSTFKTRFGRLLP